MTSSAGISSDEICAALRVRAGTPGAPAWAHAQSPPREFDVALADRAVAIARGRLRPGWRALVSLGSDGVLRHPPRAVYRLPQTAFGQRTRACSPRAVRHGVDDNLATLKTTLEEAR
jgi:hypothetical protein